MGTKIKVVLLESIGGIMGWIWIGASIASIYFLVMIIFSNATWSQLFWAIGVGAIAKWLALGFRDSANRVFFEDNLVQEGYSKQEAGKIWVEQYTGVTPKSKLPNENNKEWMKEDLKKFINDIKTYVTYCISEPISTEEIRHTSKLPIEKVIFVKRSLLYIEYLENDIQELLLKFVPLLTYYREDIPEDGYLALFDKMLKDDNSIERFDNLSKKSLDILTHDLENNEHRNNKEDVLSNEGQKILNELSNEMYFPNDLLIKCQNDSKEILKLLKSRIHNN